MRWYRTCAPYSAADDCTTRLEPPHSSFRLADEPNLFGAICRRRAEEIRNPSTRLLLRIRSARTGSASRGGLPIGGSTRSLLNRLPVRSNPLLRTGNAQ